MFFVLEIPSIAVVWIYSFGSKVIALIQPTINIISINYIWLNQSDTLLLESSNTDIGESVRLTLSKGLDLAINHVTRDL